MTQRPLRRAPGQGFGMYPDSVFNLQVELQRVSIYAGFKDDIQIVFDFRKFKDYLKNN